ncbi:MAG: hypothetical protein ABSH56_30015 [Bryobacteraceae bacterium]|jgi:hypothetical protein
MLRAVPLILVATASFAQTSPAIPENSSPQTSPTAPPEVEGALRARVTQFYQLEVEGKFYQALQLVAEDSKNSYVSVNKPTIRSFEIESIRFSDDFTKADVVVLVRRLLPLEGFMGHPLSLKDSRHWKLENGQWCYYVDPRAGLDMSPFKQLPRPVKDLPPGAANPLPPAPGGVPNPLALTVDKPSVRLNSSGPSSEQVAISNPSPWSVAIILSDPKIGGLTVSLDRSTLKAGEKAMLKIQWSGGVQIPTAQITIAVTVKQTNQIIPIKVSFAN